MAYIQGFVAAVPEGARQAYVDHATGAMPIFKDYGALRQVECWATTCPTAR